jgi:sugar phosphate isomerase/epimerase
MQIGCCGAVERGPVAQAAGFDYLEGPLVSLLGDEDEAAFAPVLAAYRASPLPVRAFNIFLPRDLKVVGPEIDRERLQRYIRVTLARAQTIGARLIVFGSGAARQVPEQFPRDQAIAQLVQFLRSVAEVAAATGITIAIEPLNRKESNIINNVAEGVELARQVDRAEIQVLADFYHMDEEAEPLEHIVKYKDWLAHIHVADTGRLAPGTGQYPYETFAAHLAQAGYEGMVSVECRWNDFAAEAGPAVQFLRRVLNGQP